MLSPNGKPIGRPSTYSDEMGDHICSRLAVGEPLSKICKDFNYPSLQTVYEWIRKHKVFADNYARSKDDAADSMADDILTIADEPIPVDEHGRADSAIVQQQRLRVDARKWIASKLKPKKYGDRITQEHSGPNGQPIQVVTGVPSTPAIEHEAQVMLPQPMLLDVPHRVISDDDDHG